MSLWENLKEIASNIKDSFEKSDVNTHPTNFNRNKSQLSPKSNSKIKLMFIIT